MKNDKDTVRTPDELFTEMQALVAEAEALMADHVSGEASDGFESLRNRFAGAQKSFTDAYGQARKRVVAGAKYTDENIRANPYQALAIAAGLGLLIGVLVGRRPR